MILTGHQPNYLPYLGFLHKIARSDAFVLVDTTQFVKRGPFGWIHRNRIRASNAEGWMWLSVPVLTSGRFTQPISEARIDDRVPWRRKHWRSLDLAYRRYPHFADHAAFFEGLYARPWERLAELNEAVIRYLLEAFGIRVPFHRSSELKPEGAATELILDLCRKLKADAYLSGVHGRDYLDIPAFGRSGVDLRFSDFAHPAYSQAPYEGFVPNLAAVDLLFAAGPRAGEILRASSR